MSASRRHPISSFEANEVANSGGLNRVAFASCLDDLAAGSAEIQTASVVNGKAVPRVLLTSLARRFVRSSAFCS